MLGANYFGHYAAGNLKMSNRRKKLLSAIALLLAVGLPSPVIAQSQKWRAIEGQPLVEFDWSCALTSAYPSDKLSRVVRATMKREKFEGAGTWGDRAFAFDLNDDRTPEYFVPLDCGGTGNCKWGVYALNPARLLGLLGAQYIYVHRRTGRYPDIITYTHMSAAEGILETYSLRKRRYAWMGDKYPTSVGIPSGNDIPDFLKKARFGCEKPGN
jgi:hypothetical protein